MRRPGGVPLDVQRARVRGLEIVHVEREDRLPVERGLREVAGVVAWLLGAEDPAQLARAAGETPQELDVRSPRYQGVTVFGVGRRRVGTVGIGRREAVGVED